MTIRNLRSFPTAYPSGGLLYRIDLDLYYYNRSPVDTAPEWQPLLPGNTLFGDESDGVEVVNDVVNYDVIKNFRNLTINAGGTVTSNNELLIINCGDTLTVNGLLSMEGKNAITEFSPSNPNIGIYIAKGGNGGSGGRSTIGLSNAPPMNGGSGGIPSGIHDAGYGKRPLNYDFLKNIPLYNSGTNGGSGGKGGDQFQISAGGAGGNGGLGSGTMYLFVNNLIIGESGIISTRGSNGGNGSLVSSGSGTGGGGGGGAGGGLFIFYKTLVNNGIIRANGGNAGTSPSNIFASRTGNDGAPGQDGPFVLEQI